MSPSSHQLKLPRSRFYAYALLLTVIFFLTAVLFGQVTGSFLLVAGAFTFIFLLVLVLFDPKKALWMIIFFLPIIMSLGNYQIDIGSIATSFLPVNFHLYANPFSLLCLFLIALAGVELFRMGRPAWSIPLSLILSLSALFSLIIFLPSKYLATGAVFEIYLLSGFAIYFLSYLYLGTLADYLKTLLIIIASALLPAAVGLIQLISGNFFYENDSTLGRIAGTFPHPNTFGSFLFVVLTLFLVVFFSVRRQQRNYGPDQLFIYLFAGALLLLFVLTYSRTAWSGLLIAVLAIFILVPRIRLLMIYGGSLFTFFLLLYAKTRERILGIFEHQMFDSMYGRYQIWDMALFRAWKKPITGYGIGSFSEIIKDTQGKATGNVYPHNDLIRFFVEGGLLGVALYLLYLVGALYYAFISFWRCPRTKLPLRIWRYDLTAGLKILAVAPLVLFTAMLVTSAVEAPSMDFTFQLLSWTILGSWLGASRKYWNIG